MTPLPPTSATTENKNATRSMWLGLGSVLCCALTGLPAIVLGLIALRSGNANGRGKAWVGIVTGALFTVAWSGSWLLGRAAQQEQSERDRVETQKRQEEAKAARQKAEGDAARRIEEARASLATGKPEAALAVVDWLHSFNLNVPSDLQSVLAKDRITKARAAVAEKRWEETRKFATEAKGADAATDGEANQLIAKATAALEKAAAAARAATEKATADKAAADKKARSVKESCSQLSRTFGPDSNLSELQKEEAWKGYDGKEFTWKLEVVDVDNEAFGSGFTVQYKCATNSPSLISDLLMTYPKRDRNFVMSLKKGYAYDIEGRLKRSSTLLGLTAEPN